MKKDIFDLSNKIIILTGGLGLIGLNYVEALVCRGGVVNIIDRVEKKGAEKILKSKFTSNQLSKIFYYPGDITSRQSLIKIRENVLVNLGRIDVLINNAALNPKVEGRSRKKSSGQSFEDFGIADWQKEIAVNLTGTMLCCQVFGSKMKSGSSIINISSTYGIVGPDQGIYPRGFVKPVSYSVSKGGIISLTKYLAAYWGPKGIRVNCLAPGGVYNKQDNNFIKKYSARTPFGRMARPDEYNGLIIYLSSDASSYSTGAVYVVDGGWTAW